MWLTDGQTDGRTDRRTPYHNTSEVLLWEYKKERGDAKVYRKSNMKYTQYFVYLYNV